MNSELLLQINKKFINSLHEGSLSHLIKTTSLIFKAPVVLTNAQYQRVELYPNKQISDDVYDQLVKSGSINNELLRPFIDSYLPQQVPQYKAFYVNEVPFQYPLQNFKSRILGQVQYKNSILGHIGIILDNQPLASWHLDVADLFIEYCGVLIRSQSDKGFDEISNLRFLMGDFFNPVKEDSKRNKAYSRLITQFPHPWRLLLSKTSITTNLNVLSRVVVSNLRRNYPQHLIDIIDGYLFVLEKESKNNDQINQIIDYLYQEGFTFNVLFSKSENILLFKNALWLANQLSQLKIDHSQKVFFIEDMMFTIGLHTFLQQPDSHLFIHPVVSQLTSEDYHTLSTLIQCAFDRKETSQRLHIHRNTLLYRLNRIQEQFTLDLNNPQTLYHLSLSFLLDALE